jgi:hypothetical protein
MAHDSCVLGREVSTRKLKHEPPHTGVDFAGDNPIGTASNDDLVDAP